MMDKLDLLRVYCKKYGLMPQTGGYWYGEDGEIFYITKPFSSATYIDKICKKSLESMSEFEIESFVINCAIREMAE